MAKRQHNDIIMIGGLWMQKVDSLPVWTSNDIGRFLYLTTDQRVYYGDTVSFREVGSRNSHNELEDILGNPEAYHISQNAYNATENATPSATASNPFTTVDKVSDLIDAPQSRTVGTIYQSLTAGFVTARMEDTNTVRVRGLIGPTSPPSIEVAYSESIYAYSGPNSLDQGIGFPVPKGYYYQVEDLSSGTQLYMYWFPLS